MWEAPGCTPPSQKEKNKGAFFKQDWTWSWAPVAHACNLSYSGGRDQEDHGLKPLGQIVHETLSQKSPSQKRAGGVAQGEGPEFKPQYHKKKKRLDLG
jgi:hypothetical protein